MKNKTSKLLIILIAIISISIFSSSCYKDDGDAVVTIHLVRNDLTAMGVYTKESIFDKIFHYFIKRAEAAPALWPSGNSNLTMTIASDSFETKTYTIPPAADNYSTTLPPGSNVTITITNEDDWEIYSAGPNQKNWGGQVTAELRSGEQELTIQMLPMTYISSVTPPSTVYITMQTGSMPAYVQSYKVYRSTTIDGSYTYVGVASYVTAETYRYIDNMPTLTYYYRVSTVSNLGDGISREGVLSDPKTW